MEVRSRPSRKCFLLLLSLALTAAPTTVPAQELVVSRGVSIDFDALTATPTTVSAVSTVSLTVVTPTPAPVPAPAPATVPPALSTEPPAMTAPTTGSTAGSGSSFRDATAGESGNNSTQPSMTPSPSPMSTPSTAAPVTAASTEFHGCNDATTSLITKFYENNDVLEGDCAAVNNYYRYPFESVPSRTQLLNMSKSASCTVLMQALLQLVPNECDFKRIPLRSTAEAILQLAKDMKTKGESVVLPSEETITKAIEARRQDLLSSTGVSGSKVDGGTATESVLPQSTSSKATSSSSSSWAISDGITSVDDDGQHILMDTDLLVVGTWSDNPDNYAGPTSSPSTSVGADADLESGALRLTDTKTVAFTPTPSPTTSSASRSLQFTTLSVQAALVLAWVSIQ